MTSIPPEQGTAAAANANANANADPGSPRAAAAPHAEGATAVRDRAEAMLSRDLTCQTLGITLEDVDLGRAVLGMTVAKEMVNGHGTAHGGYLFLLADAAFAYACNSHGPVTVAQTAQVTFLRPASPGDRLRAEAVERSRHGRSGLYDVTVTRASDGTVIAEFRGHSVTLSGNPFAERSG